MRLLSPRKMLNTGWFRLWVITVAAIFVVASAIAAYALWGQDICYRYVTISTKEGFVSVEDSHVVDRLREEVSSREYCGKTQYSALLTLEQLAKKGIVTQIGIQWREPRGWSFTDFERLDILQRKEIDGQILLGRIREYVYEARLRSFLPWGIGVAAVSVAALLLGLGVAWVRRGFQKTDEGRK